MARGRPPKPTNLLELSGAFKKHPERKRARQAEPVPKGKIPAFQDFTGKTWEDAYNLILATVPDRVLSGSDYIMVMETAKLLWKSWNEDIKSCDRVLLMASLGKLGMNPSDRARLRVEPEKKSNRWAKD